MPERMVMRRWQTWVTAMAALALSASSSMAQAPGSVELCPGQFAPVGADGRIFGHIPYAETPAADLVNAPPGFAVGSPCRIERDVLPDLQRLLAAADATPGMAGHIHAVSCFRSIAYQHTVFCRGIGRHAIDAMARARSSAPPGHSEHETGYAIDFAIRPAPGCADVNPCIAQTPAGQWLLLHAPEFGFELSFPASNVQGVTWEPWHWRWVGSSIGEPGALQARTIFNRARTQFPALPSVNDASEQWLQALNTPGGPPALSILAPTTAAPPPGPLILRR
jgi:D-alanyl-D-alanine carboxypeptidase